MKRLLLFFTCFLIATGLFAGRICVAQQAVFRAGDTLDVRLSGVPNEEIAAFSSPQAIDDGGMLNLPYIGKIKVSGMDASQAQHTIEAKLKAEKIFTNPTITLNIQTSTRLVNVTGDVKASGRVAYTADLTVMSAIAGAGGFTDFADKKRVKLVRAGKVQVLDTTKFSVHPDQDVKVLPGDQIFVPQGSGLPFGF